MRAGVRYSIFSALRTRHCARFACLTYRYPRPAGRSILIFAVSRLFRARPYARTECGAAGATGAPDAANYQIRRTHIPGPGINLPVAVIFRRILARRETARLVADARQSLFISVICLREAANPRARVRHFRQRRRT